MTTGSLCASCSTAALFLQRTKPLLVPYVKTRQTLYGLFEKGSFVIEYHLQTFLKHGEDSCALLRDSGLSALRSEGSDELFPASQEG